MKAAAPTSTAALLTTFADPIRLRLMSLLERAELSVGEIGRVVQLPQSTVSRHLKALLDAGLVSRRNEGPSALYRLMADDLDEVARSIWGAIRDRATTPAEASEDQVRLGAVLAQRRIDSQEYFGRLGSEWSGVRAHLFGDSFTAASLLGLLPSSWVVADLGCGTGEAAELLAPWVARVIGIDQSEAMLSAARERLGGVSNVELARGDLERLPLGDGAIDACVMGLVLHHVEDPAMAAAEARRVLRKGGKLVVIDMVRHDRSEFRQSMGHKHLGFSRQDVESVFSAAGLRLERHHELPRGLEVKGPGLFVGVGVKN